MRAAFFQIKRCGAWLCVLTLFLISPAQATVEFAETLAGNYLAARVAFNAHDSDNASLFWREALKDDPFNPDINERAFVSFVADGKIREALPYARRLQQLDKGHRLSRLFLGVHALKQGERKAAIDYFEAISRLQLSDVTAQLMIAWAHAGDQNHATALKTLQPLAAQKAYTGLADYHAGLIADRAGRLNEALEFLESAGKTDAKAVRIVEAYARTLIRAGKRDEAKAALMAYDAANPRNPLITSALEMLKSNERPGPQAASALIGAAEVLYSLGSILNRQGGEELSILYLQMALYLHPQHDLARLTLGDVLDQIKQKPEALEAYRSIDPANPLSRIARLEEASVLDRLEKPDEAKAALQKLVDEKPDDLEAWVALGNHLRAQKKFTESAEAYSKALVKIEKPSAGDWRIFYFRGIAYERSKQWPKAEADFKKALELQPDQPLVLNYLGYSWIDQGINLEEGKRLVRRAVELRPQDGYIVDSLGWAYYKLGLYDDAVRELERAIEIKPNDPVINDHLGDAYWKVGRRLEAQFQWRHALDQNPEAEEKPKIEAKLSKGLADEKSITPASTSSTPK